MSLPDAATAEIIQLRLRRRILIGSLTSTERFTLSFMWMASVP